MTEPLPLRSRFAVTADQQRQKEDFDRRQVEKALSDAAAARERQKQVSKIFRDVDVNRLQDIISVPRGVCKPTFSFHTSDSMIFLHLTLTLNC